MINHPNLQKKNILLVTHYYPSHRGGVEILAGLLAENLVRNDAIEITWMASDVDPYPKNVSGISCVPMKASNFLESKAHLPYPLWSLPSLIKLYKAVQQTDIVHLHDYLYMGNLWAFIWAKIHHKPIVVTQHIGLVPYKNNLFRFLLSTLNQTLGKTVLKYANKVVFYSQVVQSYFDKNKKLFYSDPAMIPNGVDEQIFYPADEQSRNKIRQDLGLSNSKLIFLFVGRFVEKKGLHILHKLAAQFPSIIWLFAGWGPLDPQSWNLDNVMLFPGRRSEQLTPLYQVADLLILPSKGEGFPVVIQEAMACGTPVMVGSETAQAYPAVKHLMFWEPVETKDTLERWSTTIQGFIQNPSPLADLRTKVAEFTQQHWSWQNCSKQYEQIFQELIASKG